MNIWHYIVAVSLVVLFVFMNNAAFADGFQSPINKLAHNPTICAFEPQPDPQFPGLGSKMLTLSQNAVLDWQQKLNQGYGKHPAWNMNFVRVPLNSQDTFDDSVCDITIHFKPKPDDPSLQLFEAGVTSPDVINHRAKIEIYYLGVNLKWNESEYTQGNYLVHVYTPVMYFTGFLAPDPQLDDTILHELGHGFGLGHYILPNDILYKITQGQQEVPSIMITTVIGYGVTHYDITPADIAEMHAIYGYDGFSSTLQQPLPNYSSKPQGTAPLEYTVHTDKPQYSKGEAITISGYLYTFNTDTTATVSVYNPGFSLVDKFSVTSQHSNWFSIPLDTSKYSLSGTYHVSVSTGTGDDTVATTTFEIASPGGEIPPWIKNDAKWWADGTMTDGEFIKSMQYLIQQGILQVPNAHTGSVSSQAIPTWVKTNAGWWAGDAISDDEFVRGIQFLIDNGIIKTYP